MVLIFYTHISNNFLLWQIEINLTASLTEAGVQVDKVWEPLVRGPGLGGVAQVAVVSPALQLILSVTINTLAGEDGAGYWSKVIDNHDQTLKQTLRKCGKRRFHQSYFLTTDKLHTEAATTSAWFLLHDNKLYPSTNLSQSIKSGLSKILTTILLIASDAACSLTLQLFHPQIMKQLVTIDQRCLLLEFSVIHCFMFYIKLQISRYLQLIGTSLINKS